MDGRVGRPLTLTLDELRARPRVTMPVTLECAGNGRARLHPRPVSQPWLDEAVGTAEWTGTPLAPLLREAGIDESRVDVVFTGADHGIERGVEQDYQRALPLAEALRPEVLLAYEMNGAPLPPQHGFPLRLVDPRLVRHGPREVADPDHGAGRAVRRLPERGGLPAARRTRDDPGEPVTRIQPAGAAWCRPGYPDFMSRTRFVRPGTHELTGRAWSGQAPVTAVEVSTDGGATWPTAELEPAARAGGRGAAGRTQWTVDRAGRYELLVRATDASGAGAAGRAAVEHAGHGQQHGPAGDRSCVT